MPEPIRDLDLSTVSPEEFAKLVDAMSDAAVREKVLDEIFTRISSRYRGDHATAGVIQWRILDKPSGGHDTYETVLYDGTCTVNREPTRAPRVTISLGAVEFLRLASGNGSPTTMFFSGRLKLTGDIGFAAGLGSLFDVPEP